MLSATMASLFQPFQEMFTELGKDLVGKPLGMASQLVARIRLDVDEDDTAYTVRAEIPGAKKEDIRVNVDGNFVSIAAEVKKEKEEKSGGRVLLKETYIGSSSRGFSLAHEIEPKGVVAKLEDGILKLTLPKREGAGSRTIEIK